MRTALARRIDAVLVLALLLAACVGTTSTTPLLDERATAEGVRGGGTSATGPGPGETVPPAGTTLPNTSQPGTSRPGATVPNSTLPGTTAPGTATSTTGATAPATTTTVTAPPAGPVDLAPGAVLGFVILPGADGTTGSGNCRGAGDADGIGPGTLLTARGGSNDRLLGLSTLGPGVADPDLGCALPFRIGLDPSLGSFTIQVGESEPVSAGRADLERAGWRWAIWSRPPADGGGLCTGVYLCSTFGPGRSPAGVTALGRLCGTDDVDVELSLSGSVDATAGVSAGGCRLVAGVALQVLGGDGLPAGVLGSPSPVGLTRSGADVTWSWRNWCGETPARLRVEVMGRALTVEVAAPPACTDSGSRPTLTTG